jgi:lipid-A-disaccharide synthase
MKIAMVAGEASGDLIGASLIKALRARSSAITVSGVGGAAMMAAGCESLFDMERLAVMGLIEPLQRLPELFYRRHQLYSYFAKQRPDIFIGIDVPDFNLGLEVKLKKLGIPIVHCVSPSVWAWRAYRIHKIKRSINHMLTLLPFEAEIYEKNNIPVTFIGHPLADQIDLHPDKLAARRALCIPEEGVYIALLPGSRRQEIKYMAEPFLKAAQVVSNKYPDITFLTTHVTTDRYQEFQNAQQSFAPKLPLKFFTRRSQDVLAAADLVLVTSGTATLEAMLYKKPMAVGYKMPDIAYALAKRIVNTRFISLPNILANEMLVPELIQEKLTVSALCDFMFEYLAEPEKVDSLQARYLELHKRLRLNAAERAVDAVWPLLLKKNKNDC